MWFIIVESIRAAFTSISAHAFRSFLTTLGIIIGVASVIATVSIIQGLSYTIGQQFQGLGSNSITIRSYTPMKDRMQGRIARLTPADLDLVSYRVSGIESITPVLYSQSNTSGQIRYGTETAFASIQGTTYTYQQVASLYAKYGRFLSDSDNKTRRRVCIIGEELRKTLSLPEDPTGEFIAINGEWIKIIGLMEPRGEIFGQSQDNFVLLPYNSMQSLMGNIVEPDIFIQLTIASLEEIEAIKSRIKRLLRDSHELKPDVDDDFNIQTAEQLTDSFNNILNSVTVVMGGIVSISLLVGGIGIMNIMLVSVTERTREIGICKAIGAKRQHILLQFLLEALILCLLGGIIGLILGYGIGILAASYIPNFPPAHTPLWAVMLALGFSVMVGMVFGILPAAKAANLDPIEALRYE